jgi:hypothetical protein
MILKVPTNRINSGELAGAADAGASPAAPGSTASSRPSNATAVARIVILSPKHAALPHKRGNSRRNAHHAAVSTAARRPPGPIEPRPVGRPTPGPAALAATEPGPRGRRCGSHPSAAGAWPGADQAPWMSSPTAPFPACAPATPSVSDPSEPAPGVATQPAGCRQPLSGERDQPHPTTRRARVGSRATRTKSTGSKKPGTPDRGPGAGPQARQAVLHGFPGPGPGRWWLGAPAAASAAHRHLGWCAASHLCV